jgi:mono/diheme cytochrome c family protein
MRLRWFLTGLIAFPILAALAAWIYLRWRADGFSARQKPTPIETVLAQTARRLAVPAAVSSRVNPVKDTPEVLQEAKAHWADHCATCHANNGSGDTPMAKGMYPPAPDMRARQTQQMTDGELFYIIENGIRMSGMPAWGGPGHDEEDSWKLVRFIRHLPDLTPQELRDMEKMNPKSPDELREEQEEEEFLHGGQPHEQAPHHHH